MRISLGTCKKSVEVLHVHAICMFTVKENSQRKTLDELGKTLLKTNQC